VTTSPTDTSALSDDWLVNHYDYLSEDFHRELHPALARMRSLCPIAHSDAHEGYWAMTKYEDVLSIAQDWETFSNELGVGIPETHTLILTIPEGLDPPIQRIYKKLISAYFTPGVVRAYEEPTRALVNRLIDDFIETGSCDFFTEFAQPFPGLAFFDLVLNAPADQVKYVNDLATDASKPDNPNGPQVWEAFGKWIFDFVADRRASEPKGDVVDAILAAEIEGRPIEDMEVFGTILLLILGGLETTAGVLGQAMLRFAREPEIPAMLRANPDLIPAAVEELLRLDGSFVAIGRTVRNDTEVGGCPIKAGEHVLISWASANRDEDEFDRPDEFIVDRERNRHLAFGAGPHRCAGSNLARQNLRVAIAEIVNRLDDIKLAAPEETLPYHTAFNRTPLSVPISFTPGPRR
jgi:cytochrome P450